MSRKKIGLGVFSTGMVVFGIAVAVVLNLAVGTLPSTLTQVDVTNEKLYTITKDTKDYLADLKEDVTIYVLSAKSSLESQDTTLSAMLEKYKDASSHISVVYKLTECISAVLYQLYRHGTVCKQSDRGRRESLQSS